MYNNSKKINEGFYEVRIWHTFSLRRQQFIVKQQFFSSTILSNKANGDTLEKEKLYLIRVRIFKYVHYFVCVC